MRAACVVALSVALFLALSLAPAVARAQSAEELVRVVGQRALAGDVRVGSATFRAGALDLADVLIIDADGQIAARLDRVHIAVRPAVFYAQGIIDAVEIDGIALKLRRMADGHLGVGQLLRGGTGGRGDLTIQRVGIGGRLMVAAPGHATLMLEPAVRAVVKGAGGSTRILIERSRIRSGGSVVDLQGAIEVSGAIAKASLSGEARGLVRLIADELGDGGAAPWKWELMLDDHRWRASLEAERPRVGESTARRLTVRSDGDLAASRGSLRVEADDVVSGGLPLGDVKLSGAGDRARVHVELSSAAAAGGVRLEAAGVPSWDGTMPVAVDGALSLLELRGRGQHWTLARTARLRIGKELILDEATLARQGAASEQVTVAGRIEPRAGRLDVRAGGKRLALRTLAAALGAELALPEVALDVRARVRGRFGAPRVELSADGVAAPDARLGGAAAAVHLEARLVDGRISGKSELRAGPARIDAAFDVPARGVRAALKLHAHAEAVPLAWLAPMAPGLISAGSAALDVDVTGTRAEPRLAARGSARLDGGGSVDLVLAGALPPAGSGAAPAGSVAAPALSGELTLRKVPLARVAAWKLPILVDGSVRLSGTARVPSLAGRVRAQATTELGVVALQGDLAWADSFTATLAGTLAEQPLMTGRLTAPLSLSSVVRGAFDRSVAVAFDGIVPAFDIARLGTPLAGSFAGSVSLHSPLDAPVVTARLTTPALRVDAVPLGPATLAVTLDRTGARATLQARPPAGGLLGVTARLDGKSRSVHLTADKLELAAADAAGRLRLAGRVDADVTFDGDSPSGTFRLSDGRARLGTTQLDAVAVQGSFAHNRMILRAVDVEVRRGRLHATGFVELDGLRPRALIASVRTEQLPLSGGDLGLWLDSQSELRLVRDETGLSGSWLVARADAHVVRAGAGRSLQPTGPLADVTVVERHRTPAPPPSLALPRLGLPLHLHIEAPGPVHIGGGEIDLSARGGFDLELSDGNASLRGYAEALPGGHFTLFERLYDVERASITCDDGPKVDLVIRREMGDVTITVELHGPLDDPTLRLSADPPVFDERQIGGLVASGDASAQSGGSAQIGGRMAGVISAIVAGRMLQRVSPIDVVKLEPGATAATPSRLEIGKFFLGDRFYLSYVYQFGGLTLPTRRVNAHQGQIQVKLVRRLSFDMRFGDAGAGAADLTFTLRR